LLPAQPGAFLVRNVFASMAALLSCFTVLFRRHHAESAVIRAQATLWCAALALSPPWENVRRPCHLKFAASPIYQKQRIEDERLS
jgi:hypothetical protein